MSWRLGCAATKTVRNAVSPPTVHLSIVRVCIDYVSGEMSGDHKPYENGEWFNTSTGQCVELLLVDNIHTNYNNAIVKISRDIIIIISVYALTPGPNVEKRYFRRISYQEYHYNVIVYVKARTIYLTEPRPWIAFSLYETHIFNVIRCPTSNYMLNVIIALYQCVYYLGSYLWLMYLSIFFLSLWYVASSAGVWMCDITTDLVRDL